MALGDFVHGKPSQQAQTQSNGGSDARLSRQRAAELARIEVPRTRLSGFLAATHKPSSQPGSSQQSTGKSGYNTHPVGTRDMFDTDVEGIDDSTTVTSLSFEKNDPPPANHQQVYLGAEATSYRNGGELSVAAGRQQDVTGIYKPITQQMQELDSDPEDHDYRYRGFGETHRPEHDMNGHHAANGSNGEAGGVSHWVGKLAVDEAPMTWERIEEALHENRNQPHMSTGANLDASSKGVHLEQTPADDVQQQYAFGGGEEAGYHGSRPRTPQPAHESPIRGRVSVRSRFMTPNFQSPTRKGYFGPASNSFIPRPSSAPGNPLSPKLGPRQVATKETAGAGMQGNRAPKPEHHHQYEQGGLFDNTDLSVLDSSDSTDMPETTLSPGYSPLSPVAKRRPSVTTPFTSDYPPNILRGKSFSDLQAESFDYNPAPAQPIFPPQEPPLPLDERLSRLKALTDDQRRVFFSGLTLAEWEESGDWLISQFAAILEKTKEARRERRQVAAVFEAEIQRRHQLVEVETAEVRKRLDDMKSGGLGVLKKQTSPGDH